MQRDRLREFAARRRPAADARQWNENLDALVHVQQKSVLNDLEGRLADYALSGDGRSLSPGHGFVSRFAPVFGDGPPRFGAVFEVVRDADERFVLAPLCVNDGWGGRLPTGRPVVRTVHAKRTAVQPASPASAGAELAKLA